jgi:tetratricopeptide (TPR) repeat protein
MDTLPGMKDFMPRVRATHAIANLLSGHSEAIDELEQALAHTQALGDQYWVAFISQYLGEAHTELGDLERAEEYFNAAAAYYRASGMYPSLARVLQSLSMLYERQGRVADAAHARTEAQGLAKQLKNGTMAP